MKVVGCGENIKQCFREFCTKLTLMSICFRYFHMLLFFSQLNPWSGRI